jgi:hypothetical protein
MDYLNSPLISSLPKDWIIFASNVLAGRTGTKSVPLLVVRIWYLNSSLISILSEKPDHLRPNVLAG